MMNIPQYRDVGQIPFLPGNNYNNRPDILQKRKQEEERLRLIEEERKAIELETLRQILLEKRRQATRNQK